jgi:hypothetical protein
MKRKPLRQRKAVKEEQWRLKSFENPFICQKLDESHSNGSREEFSKKITGPNELGPFWQKMCNSARHSSLL